MLNSRLFSILFLFAPRFVVAQPGFPLGLPAVNSASLLPPGLSGHGVAPGSRFLLRGIGLGPDLVVKREEFPLATDLEGVSVIVEVGGASAKAWVLSAVSRRVVALLPSSVPAGKGKVTVTYRGRSASTDIEVVARAFGILTRNPSGSGPAVAFNSDGSENTLGTPATPGQVIRIRGTGLGAVPGDEGAGPLSGDVDAPLEVWIGGRPASVVSKRRTDAAGLDEAAVEIPPDTLGCYVPVAAKTGAAISNFASISISNGDACSDPSGLSGAETSHLFSAKEARIGVISLSRSSASLAGVSVVNDSGIATFFSFSHDELLAQRSSGIGVSVGACTVYTLDRELGATDLEIRGRGKGLDAGPALRVTGPKGSKELSSNSYGTYWNKLGEGTEIESPIPIPIPSDLFLDAGNYTVSNTAAGKDVGTFSARLDLSSPFEWLNRESFGEGGSLAVGIFRVIPRSADLLITWRGGSAGSLVVMSGVSVAENQSGGFFLCLEEASKGRFAVPSLVLQALPSADPNKGESGIIYVANSVSGSHFDAAGLDLGMIEFTNTTIRLAAYR